MLDAVAITTALDSKSLATIDLPIPLDAPVTRHFLFSIKFFIKYSRNNLLD